MSKQRFNNRKKGFTLIELSIVLIIIGLLVGGILVGQDLIEGARIRSQINQINNYDTALNTFRLRYNELPGDCDRCGSADFGLRAAAHNGDGDGIIEGAIAGAAAATGERAYAFVDLGAAGLVDGSFAYGVLPDSQIETGQIALAGDAGVNYFIIGADSNSATLQAAGGAPTPFTAWTLDDKMDDGIPTSGRVTLALVGDSLEADADWDTEAGDASCVGTGAGGDTDVYFFADSTTGECPLKIRTTL